MAVFILCTLAVFIKQSTLPFVWIVFAERWGTRRGALYLIALGALWTASFIPYLPEGIDRIVERVLLYSAGGVNEFSLMPLRVASYAALMLFPLWYRRGPLVDKLFIAALVLHAGMPYASWNHVAVVPLMALVAGRVQFTLVFSVAWVGMMLLATDTSGLYMLFSFAAWSVSLAALMRLRFPALFAARRRTVLRTGG